MALQPEKGILSLRGSRTAGGWNNVRRRFSFLSRSVDAQHKSSWQN